jgi:hypothetical protein
MNTSCISVFSGFIFTEGTAVSMTCSAKYARKSSFMQRAFLRDISYQLEKHVWTDWQFQVLVQWPETPFSLTT